MPTVRTLPPDERRLYSKLHHLLNRRGLIRGSLVEMKRLCGKQGCHCRNGPRHRHRSLYISVNVQGKRRMIYVPPSWDVRVREWVERSDQIRDALEEISRAFVQRVLRRQE